MTMECLKVRQSGVFLAGMALLMAFTGCATMPTTAQVVKTDPLRLQPSADNTSGPMYQPAETDYLINTGDLLEVKFIYRPEFNEKVTVSGDGKIVVPFLQPVTAAGRTVVELREALIKGYRGLERAPSPDPSRKEYLIDVGDDLEVKFAYTPAFNDNVRVRPDGKISLNLVNSVVAEGKTPEKLGEELKARYEAFLKKPDLVVIVRNYSSTRFLENGKTTHPAIKDLEHLMVFLRTYAPPRIYVGGEVGKPGFLRYEGPITALQAILEAGGQKKTAEMQNIVVLRKMSSQPPTAFFLNLKTDWKGLSTNDMVLKPYDVVIVPMTSIATVNDFLDQYLYTLIPATRNVGFNFIYDLNPVTSIENKVVTTP